MKLIFKFKNGKLTLFIGNYAIDKQTLGSGVPVTWSNCPNED